MATSAAFLVPPPPPPPPRPRRARARASGSRAPLVPPLGCLLLALLCGFSAASPPHGRRLICWQAIMKCQGEPECDYAYQQYVLACSSVINGERSKCPSHCIASFVQLNLTKNGPSLEDCDCASDATCRKAKRAIEPCLPRTSSMGCTEARRQCERDPQCSAAMRDYLVHCGKLFSGVRCTDSCRSVIANMRKIPKAEQLDTCVCDGTERTICEYVKVSMKTLCFDSPGGYDGSGGGGDAGLLDSEEDDDEYEFTEDPQFVGSAAGRSARAPGGTRTLAAAAAAASTLLLLLPLLLPVL
ncbi:growth arrest-specific protein 1a [Scleropages formosus]|uniref:growth arrest-specific protein 1a n=1 Tax=Scleropages formosus TaxID=113540 RepID=UPI0010FA795A|nr:growth arrest-specific protein 1-like [Scleropages formosus]